MYFLICLIIVSMSEICIFELALEHNLWMICDRAGLLSLRYEKLSNKKRAQRRKKLSERRREATGGNRSGAESWTTATSRRQIQREARPYGFISEKQISSSDR